MSLTPPLPGKIAIILGFVLGTWLVVDGLHRFITGDFIRVPAGLGAWAQGLARWGFDPMRAAPAIVGLGVAWMVVANLYLFQNTAATWKAMLLLIVASSWYVGLATVVLVAQMILLLLPRTRVGLRRESARKAVPGA